MPCKIVGGTKVPGNDRSPGNESSRELSAKVHWNEKSRERKFPVGTIRSWEQKVLGTKSPGTSKVLPQ